MAPRLMRFYGGSAQEWLRTPLGVAQRFLRAIAPLKAEEAVHAADVAMVGRQMSLEDVENVRSGWQARAGMRAAAELPAAAGPALSAGENAAATARRFAAAGMAVTVAAHG